MYLMKKVCNRSTGMGLKIVKYHAIMHMAQDILNFGVPMCFDTGSNESGHKATKKAAKLTQKCGATFDQQTAKRLDEIRLLELAEQEFEGRVIWDYGTKHRISPKPAPETAPDESSRLVGGRIVVKWEEDMQDYLAIIHHKTNDPGRLETGFTHFMGKLQEEVFDELGEVQFRSELVRHGARFRANHCYRTRVWRDWVVIDWGEEEGQLPAKLWGFVDFTQLSPDFCVPFQQSEVTRGMFAIVESAVYSIEPETMQSELFRRIVKEVGGPNEGPYRFYLVDIESFVRPIVVIPDIGGKPNEYFELRDRDKWKEDFEAWLELPHRCDEIDMEIATMPTGTQCRA